MKKRGISLIVLIITIIVIIILAAVVILTLSKNNPIESAKEARFKEDIRAIQDELSMYISKEYAKNPNTFNTQDVNFEGESLVQQFQSAKKYKGNIEIKKGKLIYYSNSLQDMRWAKDLNVKSMLKEWKKFISDVTDDGVPIPNGFTYIKGAKKTGTVIQDENYNEFVWVPVDDIEEYTIDESFEGRKRENITNQSLPNGITDESADVKKYGGFYIGRYEAGIPEGDSVPTNKIGIPVSRKDVIVWSNINYNNAKSSAESMIDNDYVKTGFVTMKAWDTTCHFVEDYVKTINKDSTIYDSRYYGNYKNSESPANVTGYGKKQKTGYSDKWCTKNIYDLAGNYGEWTNEKWYYHGVYRGYNYDNTGDFGCVSYVCSENNEFAESYIGFRVRLYIKTD